MNKLILAAVLGLVPLLSFGQGTAIRSLNGLGTNATLSGTLNVTNYGAPTFWSLWNGGTQSFSFGLSGNAYIRQGGFYSEPTGQIVGGTFIGNGAGLTNLASATNYPAGPTYVYNSKVTFISNVVFNVIDYTTNSHPSSGNIDLAKSFAAFATNNNTTFSGLANKNAGATNVQLTSLFITNSSAAAKTVVMDASFQRMGSTEGNTLYVTNVGQLLVFHYPGFGTNYYFKSR
jgi:hypothetical protein